MSYRIKVPDPVQLVNPFDRARKFQISHDADGRPTDSKPMSFGEFIARLTVHEEFTKDMRGLLSAGRLIEQFDAAAPGTEEDVSDDDHARLKKAAEKPATLGFVAPVLVQILGHFDAIVKAEDLAGKKAKQDPPPAALLAAGKKE